MISNGLRDKLHQLEQVESYLMPESTPIEGEPEERSSAEIVKLDANENVFIPKEFLNALANEVAQELDPRFYSTREYWQLVRALSAHLGLAPDHIVLGSGGDQIIDFVAKTFLDEGAKAVSIAPTYSFYRLRAKLAGARWVEVPLKEDFSLDVGKLLEAANDARVIFLCSPNNPTGNQFAADQLKELLKTFDGIVFVDEAYAEFADETVARWVTQYENLMVLRTFSKAFGLAGLRLGYLLAHTTVARLFAEKIQYPYPISTFTLAMGLKLLARFEVLQLAIEQMKTERARLIRELAMIRGIRPFNSEANFILFQVEPPVDHVHDELMKEGLFVKKIGTVLGYENCLRTTVGTPEMNNRLLETLRRICQR
jgi:histidinol-phosphate aminotransferase